MNSDHGALAGQWREHDIGTVGLKNLANFVEASEENTVDLGSGDGDVFHIESNARNGFVQFLLCHLDRVRCLAGDEDLCRVTPGRLGWTVATHLREQGREVDGSAGGGLDELNVLSMTTTHKLMDRELNSCGVDDTAKLNHRLG